jgi:hypothetical protein
MEQRINKPKVFLSHSKADRDFVLRLKSDLQSCQIDTWFDEDDIRHGKPWISAIFEDGIPTCDGVFFYLTKSSIESQMVKKEIDAGIIHQLGEGGVSFLPYVNDQEIRKQLRHDLQTIQIPVLNDDNYHHLLPKIVAEIWRSFMDRNIGQAVRGEKVRRLEAELELERVKRMSNSTPFSDAEVADFKFLYNFYNRKFDFMVVARDVSFLDRVPSFSSKVSFNLLHLIYYVDVESSSGFRIDDFNDFVAETVKKAVCPGGVDPDLMYVKSKTNARILSLLSTYGLVDEIPNPRATVSHESPLLGGQMFKKPMISVYSNKFKRFRYWTQYSNLLPDKVEWIAEEDLSV